MTKTTRKGSPDKENTERALDYDMLLATYKDAILHRESRNGYTDALEIISFTLPRIFAREGGPTLEVAADRVLSDFVEPMLSDPEFTEAVLDSETKETFAQGLCVNLVEKVAAYCVFAMKAFAEGNESLSWSYVSDAKYWAGATMVAIKRGEMPKPGRLMAKLRHAQTYQEYEKVSQYWRDNIDPKLSAQKAADKILVADVTTLSHKKIAEIVSRLRKAECIR